MKQGFIGLDRTDCIRQHCVKPASPASSTSTRDRAHSHSIRSAWPILKRRLTNIARWLKLETRRQRQKQRNTRKFLPSYPKPTSNYVLFRDDIIDIVKKYGLAGAAAMYGISQDEAKAMVDDKPKTQIGRQSYGE